MNPIICGACLEVEQTPDTSNQMHVEKMSAITCDQIRQKWQNVRDLGVEFL